MVDGGERGVFQGLPTHCVSREPTTGRLVMLTRGVKGFRYLNGEREPEAYNRVLGLSYEQVEAMEYGALFGFDEALANPEAVRQVRMELGQPVGPISDTPKAAPPPPPAPKKPARNELPEELGKFAPWFEESLQSMRKK
jgi:hypothetical protein